MQIELCNTFLNGLNLRWGEVAERVQNSGRRGVVLKHMDLGMIGARARLIGGEFVNEGMVEDVVPAIQKAFGKGHVALAAIAYKDETVLRVEFAIAYEGSGFLLGHATVSHESGQAAAQHGAFLDPVAGHLLVGTRSNKEAINSGRAVRNTGGNGDS